jgi:hypothetical protein
MNPTSSVKPSRVFSSTSSGLVHSDPGAHAEKSPSAKKRSSAPQIALAPGARRLFDLRLSIAMPQVIYAILDGRAKTMWPTAGILT